jgi:hypothetical protein
LLARLFERTARSLAGKMNRRWIAMPRDIAIGDGVANGGTHRRPRIMIEIDPHSCSLIILPEEQ